MAVNKWDAIEKDDKTIYEHTKKLKETLSYMQYTEYLFISAQTGQRICICCSSISTSIFSNVNMMKFSI